MIGSHSLSSLSLHPSQRSQSSITINSRVSNWSSPVLGQFYKNGKFGSMQSLFSNKSSSLKSSSLSLSVSSPSSKSSVSSSKEPNPLVAFQTFKCLKKGLQECIELVDMKFEQLTKSKDAMLTSTSRQNIKATERYKKRLEYQLTRVEELVENYQLHHKLMKGAIKMVHAYLCQPASVNKKTSLYNVQCGYKECCQIMCWIESQLEVLMGSFECIIKGLVGFARLLPNDLFEVVVQHGGQKFKAKGKIGVVDQVWNPGSFRFKALFGKNLSFKASEVRMFGKLMGLGKKSCEMFELFSGHPCEVTINFNSSGSIKLDTILLWIPIDSIEDPTNIIDLLKGSSIDKRHSSEQFIQQFTKRGTSTLSPSITSSLPPPTTFNKQYPTFDNSNTTQRCTHSSTIGSNLPFRCTDDIIITHCNNESFNTNCNNIETKQRHHNMFLQHRNNFLQHCNKLHNQRPYSLVALETQEDSEALMKRRSMGFEVVCNPLYENNMSFKSASLSSLQSSNIFLQQQSNDYSTVSHDDNDENNDDVINNDNDSLKRNICTMYHSLEELLSDVEVDAVHECFQCLRHIIHSIGPLIKKPHASNNEILKKTNSMVSLTVENALDAFNFLDSMSEIDNKSSLDLNANESDSGINSHRVSYEDNTITPQQNNATTQEHHDLLLASDPQQTQHLQDLQQHQQNQQSQTTQQQQSQTIQQHQQTTHQELYTTGHTQMDIVLHVHLQKSLQILQLIHGYVKKTFWCVDAEGYINKLIVQCNILDKIKCFIEKWEETELPDVLNMVTTSAFTKQFWLKCVSTNLFYASCSDVRSQVIHTCKNMHDLNPRVSAHSVSSFVVDRLLDADLYVASSSSSSSFATMTTTFMTTSNHRQSKPNNNTIVTLFQFMHFFSNDKNLDIQKFIRSCLHEVYLQDMLSCATANMDMKTAYSMLRNSPVYISCYSLVISHLNSKDSSLKALASEFLAGLPHDRKQQVVEVCMKLLEHRNILVRTSACVALQFFNVTEARSRLLLVSEHDISSIVRQQAQQSLLHLEQLQSMNHCHLAFQMRL